MLQVKRRPGYQGFRRNSSSRSEIFAVMEVASQLFTAVCVPMVNHSL